MILPSQWAEQFKIFIKTEIYCDLPPYSSPPTSASRKGVEGTIISENQNFLKTVGKSDRPLEKKHSELNVIKNL